MPTNENDWDSLNDPLLDTLNESDQHESKTFLDAQAEAAQTVRPKRSYTRRPFFTPAPNVAAPKTALDMLARANQTTKSTDDTSRRRSPSPEDRLAIEEYLRSAPDYSTPIAPRGLDLSLVPKGRYAVPGGDTRLKILIDKPDGKWAGWAFVSDAAEYGNRRRYGKQRPAGLYEGMIKEELTIIAKDPKAAAIAYGRLTGTCCICGRKLEDAESVANGIGPICAGKFA